MKFAHFAILAVASLCSTACVSIPPLDFMVPEVGRVSERKNAEMLSLTVGYAAQTQQRRVESDATIPPIWKEALQDAIARSLIFTDGAPSKVNISVRIVEVDVPEFGIDMKTTVAALYEVVDRSSGDIILSREVRTEGIVPANYAFMGATRMLESVNRAVRNNIAEFLAVIEATDFGRPAFPAS